MVTRKEIALKGIIFGPGEVLSDSVEPMVSLAVLLTDFYQCLGVIGKLSLADVRNLVERGHRIETQVKDGQSC